jgi:hypothetical protein
MGRRLARDRPATGALARHPAVSFRRLACLKLMDPIALRLFEVALKIPFLIDLGGPGWLGPFLSSGPGPRPGRRGFRPSHPAVSGGAQRPSRRAVVRFFFSHSTHCQRTPCVVVFERVPGTATPQSSGPVEPGARRDRLRSHGPERRVSMPLIIVTRAPRKPRFGERGRLGGMSRAGGSHAIIIAGPRRPPARLANRPRSWLGPL